MALAAAKVMRRTRCDTNKLVYDGSVVICVRSGKFVEDDEAGVRYSSSCGRHAGLKWWV